MILEEMAEAVDRGAAGLDRIYPITAPGNNKWWWEPHHVNLDRLNMASGFDCVIGQLYLKHYIAVSGIVAQALDPDGMRGMDLEGCLLLHPNMEAVMAHHGFTLLRKHHGFYSNWELLTNLWKNEIRSRRRPAVPA